MLQSLPPLNAVRVFDVVVKTGSLSSASRELCISHSAVSKHMSNLERFLNCELMTRGKSGIGLTPAGLKFYERIGPALSEIRRASMDAQTLAQGVSVLKISAPASISVKWLAPRLSDFQSQNAGIVVDLSISDVCPDFFTSDLDAAVVPMSLTLAPPSWHRLFDEIIIPVGSPTVASRYSGSSLSDILNLPLIHTNSRADLWERWCVDNEIERSKPQSIAAGFGFQDFYLAIAAAIADLGVALVPAFLVTDSLQSGELCHLGGSQLETDHAYWLATRAGSEPTHALNTLIGWLEQELALI